MSFLLVCAKYKHMYRRVGTFCSSVKRHDKSGKEKVRYSIRIIHLFLLEMKNFLIQLFLSSLQKRAHRDLSIAQTSFFSQNFSPINRKIE